MKTKTIAMIMAMTMILVGLISGTLAWLTDSTSEVKNTFTTSGIEVELTETKNDFKMIPGHTIDKDPKVTVATGSEPCYVFVKITEGNSLGDYIEYSVDTTKWTKLTVDKDGNTITDTIYYMEVDGTTNTMNTAYSVLKNDKVTVKGTVTKAMMETAETTKPTLTFQAYASQLWKTNKPGTGATAEQIAAAKFTPAEAWANIG